MPTGALERMVCGLVPSKHHIALREPGSQALCHEECFTQDGFDGPYTIMYHRGRPHTQRATAAAHGWTAFAPAGQGAAAAGASAGAGAARGLAKRHYLSGQLERRGGAPVDARVPLLGNADVVLAVAFPDAADPVYVANADGDELIYVHQGGGLLRTQLGDVEFNAGDYVYIPRALVYRLLPGAGPQHWLSIEGAGGIGLPAQWRNPAGQLRMDAPYCHRDFRKPVFAAPRDEGLRALVVKRGGVWSGFEYEASPLDLVGWDGSVYPWAFPILCFQPRVGLTHLPPTWHGTFAARGALICSFVPRPVDFHPEAVPCPYPHSSPGCDEVLFYCRGNFTSRRGVGPGSMSHHPAGIPHGPHPGAYEASVGSKHTDELAVMLDTTLALQPTAAALGIEDPAYHESFR